MEWTHNKPTEPGWYWWTDGGHPEVVHIFREHTEIDIALTVESVDEWHELLDEVDGKFYGPIEPPPGEGRAHE